MKLSRASAALWANANRRNAAQNGLGDPGDAITKVATIPALIRQIGKNPAAIECLAERAHELTPEQRRAALKAFAPPKDRKAARVEPKAAKVAMPAPGALRRMADVPLRGFH